MSIITVIIPALIVLDLLWWFSADRLLRKAGWKGRVRILHSFFFGFQLAALVAVIASRQSELWDHLPRFVTTAVYLWHLLILPLLLPLLVVGAIVALVCWVIRKIRAWETAQVQTDDAGMSRRAFLAATAAFTPQLFTVGLTAIALRQLAQFRVRRMTIAIRGLRWGGPIFRRRQGYDDATIAASVEELLALRDPEAFPILLAHHPHAFDSAAAVAAQLPLTLSGHTHGGQLMLNAEMGFGPMMFRYWSGHYTHGDSHLVVSNGVGNWFPLRTRAPAEIIHLTLRSA